MSNPRADIIERGFHVIERIYDDAECDRLRAIMDAARPPGAPNGGDFGTIFHPLLAIAPEIAPFYSRPAIIAALRAVLGDEPRLAHSGGLISDRARSFTPWHHHRSEAAGWRRTDAPVSRVLANVYVDGSNEELGPLLVLPRRCDDAEEKPPADPRANLPGQVIVRCPPGSIIIFDQRLYHAAGPMRGDGRRRIFGGHYQGWSDSTPHREDNCPILPAGVEWFDDRLPCLTECWQGRMAALAPHLNDPLLRGLLQAQPCSQR